MKRFFATFVSLLCTTGVLDLFGIIGFRYPRIVENDPLVAPVPVESVNGDRLTLTDGRVIVLNKVEHLDDRVCESGFSVDLAYADGEARAYVKRRGWVCGTPWASFIRIPLDADDIKINHRELIGAAKANMAVGS